MFTEQNSLTRIFRLASRKKLASSQKVITMGREGEVLASAWGDKQERSP